MERPIFLIVCSMLFGCVQGAYSDELTRVEDSNLVRLLNNMEIIEDRQDLPLAVRVIRLRELGECDDPPLRCPMAVLYVAVSTIDEAPDQALFVLPESFGWQFDQWVSWPASDDVSEYVSFEVTGRLPAADATLTDRKYVVRVNKAGGTISAVDAR
jgi:hypothetical protein